MTVNTELFEYVITDWARNIWAVNNPNPTGTFEDVFYSKDGSRGLSKAQEISERAFIGTCIAMSKIEGKKTFLSDNALTNAWRKNVLRNSFQQRFTIFEDMLVDTLKAGGIEGAVKAYPVNALSVVPQMLECMNAMKYKTEILEHGMFTNLLEQVAKQKPPAAPQNPQPK
jgi:hypothetical protein